MAFSQSSVFELVTQLMGQGNKVVVDRAMVRFCGDDLPSAVLLSQLVYWTPRAKLAGGWIAKTKEEWYEETCLSPYLVRKATELFKTRGFLDVEVRKFNKAPTVHFRLKQEAFMGQFMAFLTRQNTPNSDNQNFDYPPTAPNSDNQNFDEPRIIKILTNQDNQNFDEPLTETTRTDTTADTTMHEPPKTAARGVGSQSAKGPTKKAHTGGAKHVGTQNAKEAEKVPVYKEAVDVFYATHLTIMKCPVVKYGGREGKDLKEVLTNLRNIPGIDEWPAALELFRAICANWKKLPKWYQQNFSTTILNSKLNEIVGTLRIKSNDTVEQRSTLSDFANR